MLRTALIAAFIGGATGAGLAAQTPLLINNQPVELQLQWTGVDALRVRIAPVDGAGNAQYPEPGPILVEQVAHGSPLRIRTSGPEQTLTHDGLRARVNPGAWTVVVHNRQGREIQSLRLDPATGTVRFPTGSGALLGLGQGGRQYDRRGDGNAFGNAGGTGHWNTAMRMTVPWLMNTAGGALYFNTVALGNQSSLVLEGGEGVYAPQGPAETRLSNLDLFMVASADPAVMLRALGGITGTASLPPRWALGYQQSYRTLGVAADARNPAPSRNDFPATPFTPAQIVEHAREFRRRNLPVDQVIYLGSGYTPVGWNTGHGSFTWNPAIFEHPAGAMSPADFMASLHALNLKVSLHMNAAGQQLHGLVSETAAASANANWHASSYWARHQPLVAAGADTFWPDEGEFNSYVPRIARVRMYFEGPRLANPALRTYGLYRGGGFPGMQRYGGWLWSGDVFSSWELLARQVQVGLNTSLSGIPFWGTDTGGFWTTPEFDGELYTRWFQFSSFNPLFRSHGRTWPIKTPFGWERAAGDFGVGEVVAGQDGMGLPADGVLPDRRVEPIARKYLELRYRLLPYTYSVVWETHRTGLPIMRPLWLHDPADATTHSLGDQYLWGRDILVAPVLERGATRRSVYLPAGGWFDYWTGERVQGGRRVDRPVDLGTMPLYVRAGAIIPTGPVQQYVDQVPFPPLTITVYPGSDGRFVLTEDNGTGLSPAPNQRMDLELVWDDGAAALSIALANGTRMIGPAERRLEILRAGSSAPQVVVFRGQPLRVSLPARSQNLQQSMEP